jgi:sulfane dehydrogenase subunit SoxC
MVGPQDLPEDDEKTKNNIAAMIGAERRALARRRQELENCDCKTGMFPDPGRRRALLAAGSALAASMTLAPARAAERKAPPGAVWRDVPDDPTKVPGTPTAEDGGYGSRSQFESEVRWRYPTATTSRARGSSRHRDCTSSATTAASPPSTRRAISCSCTG